MFKFNGLVIDKVEIIEGWEKVPEYEKIDIKRLVGYGFNLRDMSNYLRRRKEHNEHYKNFWNDKTVIFNDDKSRYLAYYVDQISDKETE